MGEVTEDDLLWAMTVLGAYRGDDQSMTVQEHILADQTPEDAHAAALVRVMGLLRDQRAAMHSRAIVENVKHALEADHGIPAGVTVSDEDIVEAVRTWLSRNP